MVNLLYLLYNYYCSVKSGFDIKVLITGLKWVNYRETVWFSGCCCLLVTRVRMFKFLFHASTYLVRRANHNHSYHTLFTLLTLTFSVLNSIAGNKITVWKRTHGLSSTILLLSSINVFREFFTIGSHLTFPYLSLWSQLSQLILMIHSCQLHVGKRKEAKLAWTVLVEK